MSSDLERAAQVCDDLEAEGLDEDSWKVGFVLREAAERIRALPAQPETAAPGEEGQTYHLSIDEQRGLKKALIASGKVMGESDPAPSTQERAGEVAAKDTAAQVSSVTDQPPGRASVSEPASAVPSPALPEEPLCIKWARDNTSILLRDCAAAYDALRQSASRLQAELAEARGERSDTDGKLAKCQAALAAAESSARLAEEQMGQWRQSAYCIGEKLDSNGPDGYYSFDPASWAAWCDARIRAAHSELSKLRAAIDAARGKERP